MASDAFSTLSISADVMLPERSMTMMRSTGPVNPVPQVPRQAAETMSVLPSSIPMAGAKAKSVVFSDSRTMVLQVSPSAGTQGAVQMPSAHTQGGPEAGTSGPGSQAPGTSLGSGEPLLSRSATRHRKVVVTWPARSGSLERAYVVASDSAANPSGSCEAPARAAASALFQSCWRSVDLRVMSTASAATAKRTMSSTAARTRMAPSSRSARITIRSIIRSSFR